MRDILFILLAGIVAASITACSKPSPGIPFEKADGWLPQEQISLQQLPPWLAAAKHPEFLAVWTNGVERRVYLDCANSIGSASITWHVYVFDHGGRLVEQNAMQAFCFGPDIAHKPRRLLAISPLRVVFGSPQEKHVEEVEESWSREEWQDFVAAFERAYHFTERRRAEYHRTNR